MSRHHAEQPPTAGDLLVSHPLLRRDVVLLLSARDDEHGRRSHRRTKDNATNIALPTLATS